MKPLNYETKLIFGLINKFRKFILVAFVLSVGVSLSETIGVTLVFPLLEGIKGGSATQMSFPFNCVSSYFVGMDMRTRIQTVALLLVLIFGIKGILTYLNNLVSSRLLLLITKYLRIQCFNRIVYMKMGSFNSKRFGDMVTLFVNHASAVSGIVYNFVTLFPRLITIIMLVSVLFLLSWQMTLTALVLIVFSMLILLGIGKLAERAGKAIEMSYKKMNCTILDALMGMKVIRLFNREKNFVESFDRDAENTRMSEFKQQKINGLVPPLFEFTGVTSLALIMLIGSLVLSRYSDASLQVLMLFMVVLFRILPQTSFINSTQVLIKGSWHYLIQFCAFIKEEKNIFLINGGRNFAGLKQSIEISNLTFGYNLNESIILNRISCFIHKGSKIGIVGPSGGGKSTITELLLRFYDPQIGQILIDGIDLKEYDWHSWRKRIGVVTQDSFLFNDTIALNIAFANPEASQKEIEQAAKRAHIHDFIEGLPKGYKTQIGERGVRLSGGQRQRICIARAILLEPEILIFDEATSSLDTESERIVQEALDDVSKGKTVITIAHRLSTVFNSDVIFVIESGKLTQKGSHKELFEQEGVYRNLVQMQSLGV